MNDSEIAKLRLQAVEGYANSPVVPVESADEILGRWEMRFGGPIGSEAVQWVYEFGRDGTVKVNGETWTWKINKHGVLSLCVTTPPDPSTPGLEDGAVTEEVRYAFNAEDGRVVLCNEDTSFVEMLTRVPA